MLDRAEVLARRLRIPATDAHMSTHAYAHAHAQISSVIGARSTPPRTACCTNWSAQSAGNREQILSHTTLSRLLDNYPSPLAAPSPDATYNARLLASPSGATTLTCRFASRWQ